MKKSLVAASIIVILGAAWAGASWYTGKQIERRMEALVTDANQQLRDYLPDAEVKLSFENYQRGIFTSKVRYVLRADGSSDELVTQVTIDHGPFPLSQLKQVNLLPALASLHAELENTPAVKPLFEITKGQSPIAADARVTYNGDISTIGVMLPLAYQQGEYRLAFSGAKLAADISHELKNITLDFNGDHLEVVSEKQGKLVLEGLEWKVDTKEAASGIRLGTQFIGAKRLQLSSRETGDVQLDGLTMASQTDAKENYLNGQFDYAVTALKIHGSDLGSGQLRLNASNVDAKVVEAFIDFYNQHYLNRLQHPEALSDGSYRQQLDKLVEQNMPRLLKGYPTLSIAPVNWKNSQGEASFSFNLDLQDPLQAGAVTTSPTQKLEKAIKRVEAHLTIPVASATETLSQIAQLQGSSAQEAQAMAPQQVQVLTAMVQKSNLITLQDGVIGSHFRYANNQVEINGNKMSLQAFIASFAGGAPEIEAAPDQPAQCH